MTDITNVPSLFKIWIFKLVVVLDVYSRFPLVFKVFSKEPTSEEIAALVQTAADRYASRRSPMSIHSPRFSTATLSLGEHAHAQMMALDVLHSLGKREPGYGS